MKKPKIASEVESRRGVLNTAKAWGCEKDVQRIFDRYDRMLRNCTNEVEAKQIAIMGNVELHKLLDCRGALICNGEIIIPQDPTLKTDEEDIKRA